MQKDVKTTARDYDFLQDPRGIFLEGFSPLTGKPSAKSKRNSHHKQAITGGFDRPQVKVFLMLRDRRNMMVSNTEETEKPGVTSNTFKRKEDPNKLSHFGGITDTSSKRPSIQQIFDSARQSLEGEEGLRRAQSRYFEAENGLQQAATQSQKQILVKKKQVFRTGRPGRMEKREVGRKNAESFDRHNDLLRGQKVPLDTNIATQESESQELLRDQFPGKKGKDIHYFEQGLEMVNFMPKDFPNTRNSKAHVSAPRSVVVRSNKPSRSNRAHHSFYRISINECAANSTIRFKKKKAEGRLTQPLSFQSPEQRNETSSPRESTQVAGSLPELPQQVSRKPGHESQLVQDRDQANRAPIRFRNASVIIQSEVQPPMAALNSTHMNSEERDLSGTQSNIFGGHLMSNYDFYMAKAEGPKTYVKEDSWSRRGSNHAEKKNKDHYLKFFHQSSQMSNHRYVMQYDELMSGLESTKRHISRSVMGSMRACMNERTERHNKKGIYDQSGYIKTSTNMNMVTEASLMPKSRERSDQSHEKVLTQGDRIPSDHDQAIFQLAAEQPGDKAAEKTKTKSLFPEIKIRTATYIEDDDAQLSDEEAKLTRFIKEKKDKLKAIMNKPLDLELAKKKAKIFESSNNYGSNLSHESPMTLAGETQTIMPQIMIEENLSTGSKAFASKQDSTKAFNPGNEDGQVWQETPQDSMDKTEEKYLSKASGQAINADLPVETKPILKQRPARNSKKPQQIYRSVESVLVERRLEETNLMNERLELEIAVNQLKQLQQQKKKEPSIQRGASIISAGRSSIGPKIESPVIKVKAHEKLVENLQCMKRFESSLEQLYSGHPNTFHNFKREAEKSENLVLTKKFSEHSLIDEGFAKKEPQTSTLKRDSQHVQPIKIPIFDKISSKEDTPGFDLKMLASPTFQKKRKSTRKKKKSVERKLNKQADGQKSSQLKKSSSKTTPRGPLKKQPTKSARETEKKLKEGEEVNAKCKDGRCAAAGVVIQKSPRIFPPKNEKEAAPVIVPKAIEEDQQKQQQISFDTSIKTTDHLKTANDDEHDIHDKAFIESLRKYANTSLDVEDETIILSRFVRDMNSRSMEQLAMARERDPECEVFNRNVQDRVDEQLFKKEGSLKRAIKRQLSKIVAEQVTKEEQKAIDIESYLKKNPHLKYLTINKLHKEIRQMKSVCTKLLSSKEQQIMQVHLDFPKELYILQGGEPTYIKVAVKKLKSQIKIKIKYEYEEADGGGPRWTEDGSHSDLKIYMSNEVHRPNAHVHDAKFYDKPSQLVIWALDPSGKRINEFMNEFVYFSFSSEVGGSIEVLAQGQMADTDTHGKRPKIHHGVRGSGQKGSTGPAGGSQYAGGSQGSIDCSSTVTSSFNGLSRSNTLLKSPTIKNKSRPTSPTQQLSSRMSSQKKKVKKEEIKVVECIGQIGATNSDQRGYSIGEHSLVSPTPSQRAERLGNSVLTKKFLVVYKGNNSNSGKQRPIQSSRASAKSKSTLAGERKLKQQEDLREKVPANHIFKSLAKMKEEHQIKVANQRLGAETRVSTFRETENNFNKTVSKMDSLMKIIQSPKGKEHQSPEVDGAFQDFMKAGGFNKSPIVSSPSFIEGGKAFLNMSKNLSLNPPIRERDFNLPPSRDCGTPLSSQQMSNEPVSIMNKTAQFLRASDSKPDIDPTPSSFVQFNYSREIDMMKTPEGTTPGGMPLSKFPNLQKQLKEHESPTFPAKGRGISSKRKIQEELEQRLEEKRAIAKEEEITRDHRACRQALNEQKGAKLLSSFNNPLLKFYHVKQAQAKKEARQMEKYFQYYKNKA